jgi:hypothetical protein
MISEKTGLNKLEQQIILYSKHQFKRSESVLQDLNILQSKYCDYDPELGSYKDVFDKVSSLVVECLPKHNLKLMFEDWFKYNNKSYDIEKMTQRLLVELSELQVRDVKNNITVLELGKPDYTWLPKPDKKVS